MTEFKGSGENMKYYCLYYIVIFDPTVLSNDSSIEESSLEPQTNGQQPEKQKSIEEVPLKLQEQEQQPQQQPPTQPPPQLQEPESKPNQSQPQIQPPVVPQPQPCLITPSLTLEEEAQQKLGECICCMWPSLDYFFHR